MIKNNAILRWLILVPFSGLFYLASKLNDLIKPKVGVAQNVVVHYNSSKDDGTSFLTTKNLGMQYCTYYIQGSKYFRFSFAKNIFNIVIVNIRLGSKQNKHIFKIIMKWL